MAYNLYLKVIFLTIFFGAAAQAANIDITLSDAGNGQTQMHLVASGQGMTLGLASTLTWSNLVRNGTTDPFSESLQSENFEHDPFSFQNDISMVSITFDSDFGSNDDDISLLFDDSVDLDGNFQADATRILNLDFNLLNPGVYTSVNNIAELTLTIVSTQAPTSIPILSGMMPLLFGILAFIGVFHHMKN